MLRRLHLTSAQSQPSLIYSINLPFHRDVFSAVISYWKIVQRPIINFHFFHKKFFLIIKFLSQNLWFKWLGKKIWGKRWVGTVGNFSDTFQFWLVFKHISVSVTEWFSDRLSILLIFGKKVWLGQYLNWISHRRLGFVEAQPWILITFLRKQSRLN